MGHTVKVMSPQFVKPYVMSNKNDSNDAKGIAELPVSIASDVNTLWLTCVL
jgi:transposase